MDLYFKCFRSEVVSLENGHHTQQKAIFIFLIQTFEYAYFIKTIWRNYINSKSNKTILKEMLLIVFLLITLCN